MKCAWIACELDAVVLVGKVTDEVMAYCFPHALDRMHAELFDVHAGLRKLQAHAASDDLADEEREQVSHAILAFQSAIGANEVGYLLRRADSQPIADGWIFATVDDPGNWNVAKDDATWMGEPTAYQMLEAVMRVVGTRVYPQVICDRCGTELPGDWPTIEGDRLCSTCAESKA